MRKPEGQVTRFRFSAEKLAALPTPKDGPAIYYDTDVPQLGFRIQPTGKTKFFVLKKVAGKTHRRTLQSLKLDAARKHAHKLLSDVADWLDGDKKDPCPMVRPLDDDKLTLKTAFELYLKAPLKNEGKPNKVVNREKADARRQYLFDHCFEPLASKPVDEFTPTMVGTYHAKLEKKFGKIMANRGHEVLRATFNHLIKKELWTKPNPSVGATRAPKHDRARILEDDELRPFLDALDTEKEQNRDFAEFLALLLATGARKSNLYAAEWAEISEKKRTWSIPGSKYKNGETTVLELGPEAVQIFRERRERRTAGNPWVFPSKMESASGHVEDFKNQFNRVKATAGLLAGVTCCERAKELFEKTGEPHTEKTKEGDIKCIACGKQDLTFHDLRRTFVANLVMENIPMPVASKAAGHANTLSMAPYARFSKGAVAKALEQGSEGMKRRMAEAEEKLLSS